MLDPFIGSGTTAIAAMQLGRRCIGIEMSPAYFQVAKQRTDALQLPMPLFLENDPAENNEHVMDEGDNEYYESVGT